MNRTKEAEEDFKQSVELYKRICSGSRSARSGKDIGDGSRLTDDDFDAIIMFWSR